MSAVVKKTAESIDLSVVIPAFNEEGILAQTLQRVIEYLRSREGSFEVLVVDDGSYDQTVMVGQRFEHSGVRVLSLDRNRGKGAAVRHGVLASRGAQVLITDADLSSPIEDLPLLVAALEEAPVVFGSRSVATSKIDSLQPMVRQLMGRVFNLLARWAGASGFADTQCGFKLLDGPVGRELFVDLTTDGFAWDVELVWWARRQGYELAEVGVSWADHRDSKVRPVIDSLAMFFELMSFRWRHHRQAVRRRKRRSDTRCGASALPELRDEGEIPRV